ncbi:hypothetical protein M413DRAFT_431513 [Hebeloma cylindrosporum]|uniref:Uncharacterized protein n=1 Tax=Hebeloma cylindrosporum TaxID=76867 RepID=A0A0C2Y3Q7_HEBCY|nr:hypothetical protein M413DRAFT_431513 [Hebeloma cylindrosporum h7]
MADRVKGRDRRCCVSPISGPLVNSHICPKRIGDHIGRIIYETFTSLSVPQALSIYDEGFGLSLTRTLDAWFDKYELGFRYVSPNMYQCHMFAIELADEAFTMYGTSSPEEGLPVIHGHRARPPNTQHTNLPPPGLFRWHYLQCVLKRFAHDDYKILSILSFPSYLCVWRVTLMMMARTASWNGLQRVSILAELWRKV